MNPWYSIDRQGKVVEHEPVTLEQAIALAHEYFGRADLPFEDVEEATEATMFGIGSTWTFIEFGIISPSHISCRFETSKESTSWLSRIFGGVFQRDSKLVSEAQMIERIREFYRYSPEELMIRYK